MKAIRIASRAGKLARTQCQIVSSALQRLCPDMKSSIVTVSTKGDRDKSQFLYESKGKGLFTSEVEKALLDGRADMAVHSLKDLPIAGPAALVVAAIPKREFPADVLIASRPVGGLADLPAGATVGTSSLRRIAQLRHFRPDLRAVPLRGNVQTRLSKVASGKVDAVIVAFAGVSRLGFADKISAVLAPEEFLIAPGQGALAVQIRRGNPELVELASKLDHEPTRIATEAERHVLAVMHGGCSIPLGAYARLNGEQLLIDAMIADVEGRNLIRRSTLCLPGQAQGSAEELAGRLLAAGGQEILEQFRNRG